jgi:hypothetical protein
MQSCGSKPNAPPGTQEQNRSAGTRLDALSNRSTTLAATPRCRQDTTALEGKAETDAEEGGGQRDSA